MESSDIALNRHGRIQNILATHGYKNTDWFFNMVLCVFMVKVIAQQTGAGGFFLHWQGAGYRGRSTSNRLDKKYKYCTIVYTR